MKILELFATAKADDVSVHRPYLIAEVGVNHEGSMDTARRLVDEAKQGGADAVKFQTYKADTLASKHSPAYWDTSKEPTLSQHALFSKHDKFWKKEMVELADYCRQVGIEFMSTPFDVESAAFLNDLMDVFKISSSDITNKPFIEYMCGFGKPIILSTGASDLSEIKEAVGWIEAKGNPLALLHCILNYPTDDKDANLGMIQGLRSAFPRNIIGYSDHTLPNDMKTCEVATLLGSRIIEKHFTHDKTLPGNDHYHAMDMRDIQQFHRNLDRTFLLLGRSDVSALPEEEPARRNARRSLVAARPVAAGAVIQAADLTFKRPAHGISPKDIDQVIGRVAAADIAEDDVLQWQMLA